MHLRQCQPSTKNGTVRNSLFGIHQLFRTKPSGPATGGRRKEGPSVFGLDRGCEPVITWGT